jgi:glucosylceramidase
MKSTIPLISSLMLACGGLGFAQAHAEPTSNADISWICSTEKSPWQQLTPSKDAESVGADAIKLDPKTKFQTIDGFGGCFNELGWEALISLPAERREAALKALFSPEGANFTLCRAPIGANDFSLGWYSLDETPGDYEMKDFSIERNRESLIPFIKAAMKYQPKIGVWAVPWCPPSWMTTNGRYRQGSIKADPQTLDAYALYFSKFVQAWRAEGINLYAIHPQNEPALNDNLYPQCHWTGEELNLFLRDHLLPRLKQDKVNIEVWMGTIVNGNIAEYTDHVLGDPKTAPDITGVGYQYGGQKTLLATHEKYPDKKLAQTETECYGGGNSWDQGMTTFGRLVEDTTNFAGSYFFWNMVLDESGLSNWNWRQNSLLTVDRRTEKVIYNPEYYAMKHFSATVMPGARRIAVSGGSFKQMVAFQNPDGSKVLAFANDTDKPVSAAIKVGGATFQMKVPALSMNTLLLH